MGWDGWEPGLGSFEARVAARRSMVCGLWSVIRQRCHHRQIIRMTDSGTWSAARLLDSRGPGPTKSRTHSYKTGTMSLKTARFAVNSGLKGNCSTAGCTQAGGLHLAIGLSKLGPRAGVRYGSVRRSSKLRPHTSAHERLWAGLLWAGLFWPVLACACHAGCYNTTRPPQATPPGLPTRVMCE